MRDKEDQFDRFRRGWIAGAGFKPITEREDLVWMDGWSQGRSAFRFAMDDRRALIGLPPSKLLNPAHWPKEHTP